MNHTMFYLMSWVREKLEKKHINNEMGTGRGRKRRREKKTCLRLLSKQVRRPFEVYCFSTVNSLRTCVISECKGQLGLFPTWKCQRSPLCYPLSHSGPWKAIQKVRGKKTFTISGWYFSENSQWPWDYSVNTLWFKTESSVYALLENK